MKYLNVLNDPDENQRKARKLPRYLIDRWSREVDRWLNKDEEQRQSGRASSNVASSNGLSPVLCVLQLPSKGV